MATKQQIRENFFHHFDRKLESIKSSEEIDCFYVSGTDSRELLGAINFAWLFNYITDEENAKFRAIAYEHLTTAERKIKHSL